MPPSLMILTMSPWDTFIGLSDRTGLYPLCRFTLKYSFSELAIESVTLVEMGKRRDPDRSNTTYPADLGKSGDLSGS